MYEYYKRNCNKNNSILKPFPANILEELIPEYNIEKRSKKIIMINNLNSLFIVMCSIEEYKDNYLALKFKYKRRDYKDNKSFGKYFEISDKEFNTRVKKAKEFILKNKDVILKGFNKNSKLYSKVNKELITIGLDDKEISILNNNGIFKIDQFDSFTDGKSFVQFINTSLNDENQLDTARIIRDIILKLHKYGYKGAQRLCKISSISKPEEGTNMVSKIEFSIRCPYCKTNLTIVFDIVLDNNGEITISKISKELSNGKIICTTCANEFNSGDNIYNFIKKHRKV